MLGEYENRIALEAIVPRPEQQGLIRRVWAAIRGKLPEARDFSPALTTDSGLSLHANIQAFSAYSRYEESMRLQTTKRALYDDYERMDRECVELSAALDVTVGNVFLPMENDQEAHEIVSNDQRVVDLLNDLDRRVEMHELLPEWCKSLLKFGDSYEENVIDGTPQVSRLKYLNARYMRRNEDPFGRLNPENAFSQVDDAGQEVVSFQAWQVVHTRFRHERGNLHGCSFYDKSRRPWRQLAMSEDGVVIRRLTKSGKRFAFYIPVPKNVHPEEKKRIVQETINRLRRRTVMDSEGRLDLQRSPIGDEEDIFIPVEEGAENRARVEVFDAGGMNDPLTDILYFRDKELLPTFVPKAYLGLEADTRGRAMLGWQDVHFGRNIRVIQKLMAGAQRKVYDLELVLKGIVPTPDLYTVKYPAVSAIDEQARLTIEQTRWTIAQAAHTGLGIPVPWLLENVVRLSEKDVAYLATNLKEPQSQPMQPPGGFGEREMRAVKDAVFSNLRLQSDLYDLRERLRAVIASGVLEPVEVRKTPLP